MTSKFSTHKDADEQKGAVEGDRPDQPQMGNPHDAGIDEEGLPDDPIGTAEDVEGANADKTTG